MISFIIGFFLMDNLNIFGKTIRTIFGGCVDVRNAVLNVCIGLFKMDPTSWQGGAGWNLITTVNSAFVSVGASLLLIFWLIGLCSDSLDIRSNLRLEVALKQLARLVVGEFVVTNSLNIIKGIFLIPNYLTSKISDVKNVNVVIMPLPVSQYLDKVGFFEGIALLFLTLIAFVVVVITSLGILYIAYTRIFKILMIIPLGSIAYSTLAGNHSISSTAIAYTKYLIGTLLEGVLMILALGLGSYISSASVLGLSDGAYLGTFSGFSLWLVNFIIINCVMLGAVKEASSMAQRAFG